MEFRSVFVSNPAQLSVRRGQLVIRQEEERSVPMEDLSALLLESRAVSITTAALQELTDHGVTVYLCDETHLPAALVLPMNRHSRQLKLLKGQIAMRRPTQKRVWQGVVMSKISNQARCLSLLRKDEAEELRELADQVRSGDPDNWEAVAAARYFPALFGAGFTRGEECRVNAALNYGYAILRGAVARHLVMRGLEPCLGIFHHSELNRFNLADDLMEPYRPLVDLYVASHVPDDEGDLTPAIKQQLFQLSHYLVEQGGKQFRAISAIGRMADSFSRIVQSGEGQLELPHLLPLQLGRYE
ncbi:MAG TPA: type II CRISPR-associated endonuclease Cas1 [Candidatus Flavonifractor merdipullorum]|uniref:CRISPR-associated endonuclease Cas1 n=1 Tax=Candidatus Flavonifractor merdipullorum TaxID=2838590 RepID=A0A9D1RT50_9FIRM|nr:type II CRISPR-associated endonuclease Cas1 [Candidatus Flavonifractor merdipullorum]